MKLRFLVTRNWVIVILNGLFEVNILPNLQPTNPTAQEDSPAFRAIATFQQSIPSHTKAINGLHWSYARKIICWTTHPHSVFCSFFGFPPFFCSFGVVSAVVPLFSRVRFGVLGVSDFFFFFSARRLVFNNLDAPNQTL